MVSRQEVTLVSRKRDIKIFGEEFHNSFKKTKLEDQSQGNLQSTLLPNSESMRSVTFDFKLHLHTPLPSNQEKSTEPKGYSRTYGDHHRTYPKDSVVVERPKMSLDLELNLSPSYSRSKTTTKIDETTNHNATVTSSKAKNSTSPSKKTTLSWLDFDGGDDVDHKEQEMVTKVCVKCHMLVMLCTSNPVCPNCKFMHPHDHSSTKLFKPPNLLRLLC